MISKLLNQKWGMIACAVFFSWALISCNDENSSSSETPSSNAETVSGDSAPNAATSGAATSGTDTSTAKKKKGKASATMAAEDEKVKIEMDKTGVYTRADVAPGYAGGQQALDDYINNRIEYPVDAIDNNVEGTVYVQFAVDEKGKVTNVTTVGNPLGYGLEEEAKKVVSGMPDWTPGTVKGKKVKVWRTLPIVYRLES